MNLQIVGKVRLALTPFEPQWANVPLYLSARGLSTTPMTQAGLIFQIDADLIDHQVVFETPPGDPRRVGPTARPGADFFAPRLSPRPPPGLHPPLAPPP